MGAMDDYLNDSAPAKGSAPTGSAMDAYLGDDTGAAPADDNSFKSKALHALDVATNIDPFTMALKWEAKTIAKNPQAALEHFGNSAALGYLPQIQAATEPAFNKVADLVTGNHVSDDDDSTYVQRRDENIKRLAQEKQDAPAASMMGNVGGALTSGIAASALTPINAATKLGRIAQAGKAAAMVGGAYNPGDTEGEVSPLQLGDRLKNATISAPLGMLMQAGAEAVGSAGKWASDALKSRAEQKAAKAMGIDKGAAKVLLQKYGPDAVNDLGRTALDNDLIGPLQTPEKIAVNASKAKDAAGADYGALLDDADQAISNSEPVGFMKGGKTIQATPIRPSTTIKNTQNQTFYPQAPSTVAPDFSSIDPSEFTPRRINGAPEPTDAQLAQMGKIGTKSADSNLSAANASGFDPYSGPYDVPVSSVEPATEQAGPSGDFLTPIKPKLAGRINAPDLSESLRDNGELTRLRKIPGMESVATKIDTFLDTLANNPDQMTLRQAQDLRQGIDAGINFSKRVPDMAGTQQYLYKIRDTLADSMNDAVNAFSEQTGAGADALKSAGRKYSDLSRIQDIATKRSAGNAANRAIGLTDTISGAGGAGAGAAIGGMAGGLHGAEIGAVAGEGVGMGLNKIARTFGPGMDATASDAMSKLLSGSPDLQRLVASNPAALPMLTSKLLQQNKENPSPEKVLGPDVIEQLKRYPQLIDNIDDPKLKEMAKQVIGRSTASEPNKTPDQTTPIHPEAAKKQFLEGN